ncbi:helix-turn-helix domain-containing protein [Salipiger aestuarii]|uniref:Transposase n=1 Tax=Salipiger aestuarii TaxID=568098 RepID=A0A327XYE5_9RHOB|nr:hypothetical protein [Salipiger aestuarii]EIE52821.1 hypothetical protein C357_01770 [Citreicella sp. 357]RAK12425.1 hypothetical protein ATI53_104233 [Salipiger aestuarii]
MAAKTRIGKGWQAQVARRGVPKSKVFPSRREAQESPYVSEIVRCATFPLCLGWAGQDNDVEYSPERKSAMLKRTLPPNSMAIRQLSQEEGISEAARHQWRAEARSKGQLLPDADAGPEG